jgi:hypothetical protein
MRRSKLSVRLLQGKVCNALKEKGEKVQACKGAGEGNNRAGIMCAMIIFFIQMTVETMDLTRSTEDLRRKYGGSEVEAYIPQPQVF